VNPDDEVQIGDEIDALVMTKEDTEGRLILSKKRARFELAWKAIETAAESGEAVNGRVIEVVKGGLILDLGVRGFLPASLVDIRRVQDLDEFLGKELRCKVIELNRSRNNVVLSRRAVLEDERKEMRQAILDRLNAEVVKALKTSEFQERLSNLGADPIGSTQRELAAYLPAQLEKMRKAVKDSGARPD